MNEESISALVDGELAREQLDFAISALRHKEGQEQWRAYHLIADTLQSADLAFEPSSDFSRRLAARLEAEPALSCPGGPQAGELKSGIQSKFWPNVFPDFSFRRFLIPGVAAAAAVGTVSLMSVSQLNGLPSGGAVSIAQTNSPDSLSVDKRDILTKIEAASAGMKSNTPVILQAAVKHQPIEELSVSARDMDDYLIAHQNVSPSVQSSAQYVRHSIFATDPEK